MVNEICSKLKLNFYIYFTTIDKWVLQLILSIIFLIGMDISMRGSLRWEKAGVPRENQCQAGNHHTVSHTTTVNHGDQTWVTSVRNKCIVHCATLNNPVKFLSLISIYYIKLQLQCINFDKLINYASFQMKVTMPLSVHWISQHISPFNWSMNIWYSFPLWSYYYHYLFIIQTALSDGFLNSKMHHCTNLS